MFQSRTLISVLLIGLFSTALVYAQEESDSLTELVRQWKELDSELATKAEAFELATESEAKEDIRGQYQALLSQSEELVTKIREKANSSLDSTPDAQTAKVVVGTIMNDASFDRHNQAMQLGDRFIAAGGDGSLFELAAKSDRLAPNAKELIEELFVRFNQMKQDDLPQVKIETTKGEIVVELFEDEAPNTVANFVSLVDSQFYDGLKFHRVIEGFVAQGGDPNGNGSGGPGYSIKCECDTPEARQHFYGSLSMAHAGKDTGGSQFFLCLSRTSTLDGRHTVFGRVIDGIEVLEKLSRNATMTAAIEGADTDSIKEMKVVRKRDHDYVPVKVGDETRKPEPPPAQPETISNKSDSADKDNSKSENDSKPETDSEDQSENGNPEESSESAESSDDG